ncbi:MAG: pyridine nucleotide-disulfide oxidoreductase [Candidatus Peregrinibacteria bacterium GW2011_GWC2_39_14]|nr:MAG: pyridine nucleotide-disulfide oxidoreductase [Candidatus Peregrinibacteria bacterium GW2011_GWC2_39_14]
MEIAIIGAGAAGMMAAALVAESHKNIDAYIIDRNTIFGKKVALTGGGRCNVTTGLNDIPEILNRYPRGSRFLKHAMYNFPPERVREFFENHGVPLKEEKDLRVFPCSENGIDIVKAFEKIFLENKNIHILKNQTVFKISKKDDKFLVQFAKRQNQTFDAVIITTGGKAYMETGSVGDGYEFAQSLGHKITELAPGLSALATKETWTRDVSGISFNDAEITAGKHTFRGPFLFTHKGISGPAVFAISSLIAYEKLSESSPLPISIDLFPNILHEDLSKIIRTEIQTNPKKAFKNIKVGTLAQKLTEIIGQITKINPEKRISELTKNEMHEIAKSIKNLPLNIVARISGEEFVTAGGVDLSEVDPKTMQSKICPGLFFGGEVLDIDGFTGGFNLQAAWATGRLAGESIAKD